MSIEVAKPKFIEGFTIPDAYYELNYAIWTKGIEWQVEAPYNELTKALLNVTLHIRRPEIRPLRHPEAPTSEEYISLYAYSKILTPEKAAGETYTYGERLRKIEFMGNTIEYDQFEKAIEKLKKSPTTRRCVLVIARPWDLESTEPPCLREVHIWLEPPSHNKLQLTTFIRSWDAHGAANANLGALQLMQEEIARELGMTTGSITVFASNAHIYETSFPFVQKWLEKKPETKEFYIGKIDED
jgi:thymidylate synthase (methanogen type)